MTATADLCRVARNPLYARIKAWNERLVSGAYGHSRIRQFLVGSTTTRMPETSQSLRLLLRQGGIGRWLMLRQWCVRDRHGASTDELSGLDGMR